MLLTQGAGKWLKYSVLNLVIIAMLGVLMRYKIGFEFPYFDQKNIQHAHSHFAFAGWIAHTLYTLIYYSLNQHVFKKPKIAFDWLIPFNLVCAYGMLVSFFVQGYGPVSILFSTCSVGVSFCFAFCYFRLNPLWKYQDPSVKWIKAALLFNVLSSVGTFLLAYMMVTKHLEQTRYLASVYFYLHFQYNGWFTMACIGLFVGLLYRSEIVLADTVSYRLLVVACLPAYFLSTLWYQLPVSIYALTVVAAFAQAIGWTLFLRLIWRSRRMIQANLSNGTLLLFLLAAFAMSIKFVLQLGSTVPEISKLAFGFRPIVIAYLHLVLLGVITIFLLGFLYAGQFFSTKLWLRIGLILFVGGIFLNELILLIQGIASFSYILIPRTNEGLLFVAALMLVGLLIIVGTGFLKRKNLQEKP